MWLPPELWWEILLESVVDTALQSDSDDCLAKSLVAHALVCKTWSYIVREPLFRRTAAARLFALGSP